MLMSRSVPRAGDAATPIATLADLLMRAPRSLLAVAGCAAGLLALPAAAGARAYDVHIYRVTSVNLQHRVETKVDGQPRPDQGAALDGTATWSTRFRGPVGAFGYARTSRNAAFLRISMNGSLTGRAGATATQQGSWTETTIRTAEDDAGNRYPVTETRSGTCGGSNTVRTNIGGVFRRSGGVYRFLLNPPQASVTLPDCEIRPRGSDPDFYTATASVRAGAGARTVRVSHQRTRTYTEDGAVVKETRSLTGTITMRRVKFCPFRRGGNQYGCVGLNPDGLG
jgi:hypothetical protein